MSLSVLEPGLFSLLVDDGRPRSRSLGLPLGGAADRTAFAFANALLGNAIDSPALEVTLRGPTLRAEHPIACVIFGAPFDVTVNASSRAAGTTFTLAAGDLLRVGGTATGARAYLGVAGGFDAPQILGSRSALAALEIGDTLRCQPSRTGGRSLPFVSLAEMRAGRANEASTRPTSVLRVLDGPQCDWFRGDAIETSDFEVLSASNRMGLRLRGAKRTRREGEMISEAVAPGAVQVANDGQPIVLGVDGQTIGGYPKIAHVIRADLDRLAQFRPGESLRFERVSEAEADDAANQERTTRLRWLRRLQLGEVQTCFLGPAPLQ